MNRLRRRSNIIPRWEMPSDPVKAVIWFIHWVLRVLVRFFWVPILVGVAIESLMNGIVGGIVTLLVGLGVWLGLGATLFIFNIGTSISNTLTEVSRIQQGYPPRRPFRPFPEPDTNGNNVVEGTVTDLEEERRKRKRE